MKEKIETISLTSCSIDYEPPCIKYNEVFLYREDFPLKIIGKNGSGKSSLLLALTKAIPESIWANVSNLDLIVKTDRKIYKLPEVQSLFRLIPQRWQYGLLGFDPIDEIKLVPSTNKQWREYVLSQLQIYDLKTIPSSYLSDGEKKRLIICTALLAEVPLIISDEWTTHLDNYWINQLEKLFNQYFERGGIHLSFFSSNCKTKNEKIVKFSTQIDITDNNHSMDENIKPEQSDATYLKNIINSINSNIIIDALIKYRIDDERYIKLEANNSDIISIIGSNGSGKTTLLRNLWYKSNNFLKRFLHKSFIKEIVPKFLFIPTDPLYHILGPTLEDEVNRILLDNTDRSAIKFISELVGVKPDTDVLTLSYGQRKILATTIAVISDYPVIAVDEPFAGLDEKNHKYIEQILKFAADAGKIIIVTDQKLNIKNATKHITLEN